MVKSSPGVTPKPRFDPNLDSTGGSNRKGGGVGGDHHKLSHGIENQKVASLGSLNLSLSLALSLSLFLSVYIYVCMHIYISG